MIKKSRVVDNAGRKYKQEFALTYLTDKRFSFTTRLIIHCILSRSIYYGTIIFLLFIIGLVIIPRCLFHVDCFSVVPNPITLNFYVIGTRPEWMRTTLILSRVRKLLYDLFFWPWVYSVKEDGLQNHVIILKPKCTLMNAVFRLSKFINTTKLFKVTTSNYSQTWFPN